MTRSERLIEELHSLADPDTVRGMARYGISGTEMLGIPMPALRAIAKRSGKDHALASGLWKSGIHEARILASLVEDPVCITERQMDAWTHQFNSWDICDQCCLNIFDKTPHAHSKAIEWSAQPEEFVKRAGFALMAVLAVHDRKAADARFVPFLTCIEREACDERNFVRKAVNWALRQIGKRNERLNRSAVAVARRLVKNVLPSARWIGSDALRELTDPRTIRRMRRTAEKTKRASHGKKANH